SSDLATPLSGRRRARPEGASSRRTTCRNHPGQPSLSCLLRRVYRAGEGLPFTPADPTTMPDSLRTAPVPRERWGAEHGRGDLDPGPEKRVVIHHSFRPALDPNATPEEERAAVRAIERFHVENNGWAGIGYNWLVAPSGRIYEGRGWKFRGAHAGPVNGESIGICLLI